jgi:membrane fusion protein (multidrug efflux system)
MARVRRGMAVEITVDAYPDHELYGTVESIYPSSGAALSLIPPENATGNFTKIVQRIPVRITLKSTDGLELRPGMSTYAKIHIQ